MKRKFASAILIIIIISQLENGALSGSLYHGFFRVNEVASAATEVRIESEKELINTIYQALLNRNKTITIKYSLPDYKLDFDKLFENVLSIDSKKTAKDGDYLEFSLSKWSARARIIGSNTTLNLDFTYKTTLKEEQAVDKKVKSVLQELELEDASDFEKVKEIHDYIINRVSYDDKLIKASAYDALIDKSAVCEGYSMLAYRMFAEAGLESKIISGIGNGGPHAWNIVKVGGKWYNIDLTWDDPISSDGKPMLVYDFFLKSTKDFIDHKRAAEYKTDTFVKTYPISKTSYKVE